MAGMSPSGRQTAKTIAVADSVAPKAPFIYANGLCVNVDGGMYLGGPGFVYRLPE